MAPLQKLSPLMLLCVSVALLLFAGCGGAARPDPPSPAPLSPDNLNLIFVASEDIAYQSAGDVSPQTGNLTNSGLQRVLLNGTFLRQNVLGGGNVSGIHALSPMTHLQTANGYPDMAGLETMEQFAVLNQITLTSPHYAATTENSFPIRVSYSSAPLPDGVAQPQMTCAPMSNCQGLDFRDVGGVNEALVGDLIDANAPASYVFSAPWETIGALMENVNRTKALGLTIPTSYAGPNFIYAVAITSQGTASLTTYNTNVNPLPYYPVLPSPGVVTVPCKASPFRIQVTGGSGGAVVPAGINTNETVYFIRHAEAHPVPNWEDGNYVGAGQWRALDLPNALRGKIDPRLVMSIDPAQAMPGGTSAAGVDGYSYVRTNTTVLPYAIANNLPYKLAASFEMAAQNPPALATQASDFFFTGGQLSNQKVLVGWEHDHIPPTVNALLATYHGGQAAPNWSDDDYDTVWTVRLDEHGNVTVDNLTCEGISSTALPAAAPRY